MLLMYPLVILLRGINRLVGAGKRKEPPSRAEVIASARLGHEAGAMDSGEFAVMRNTMMLDRIPLSKILTPRTVLLSLPETTTIAEAVDGGDVLRFARIPIHGKGPEEITGHITRVDVMDAYRSKDRSIRLAQLVRPIQVLPESGSVDDAFETMLRKREHIVMVVDEYGGLEGIVTLEDAIETILGREIVDVDDEVVDFQQLARDRAQQADTDQGQPPSA